MTKKKCKVCGNELIEICPECCIIKVMKRSEKILKEGMKEIVDKL